LYWNQFFSGMKMADSSDISDQDKALFRRSVGNVEPIRHEPPVYEQAGPKPELQRQARLRELFPGNSRTATISTEPGRLLDSSDELYFKRPGIQQKVIKKLKRGQFRVEATADFHGETVDRARQSLRDFLRACHHRNNRCVLIIHGKGHGSSNRKPVLKNRIDTWLRESGDVLAFCSARPEDGGTGAVYVLLKKDS